MRRAREFPAWPATRGAFIKGRSPPRQPRRHGISPQSTGTEIMIEVNQLTKRYARHEAVRDIDFSVARGEIVGFLGPNGAGKTTTLRMLTGYLPPTSGTARIAGFDIFRQSIEARRKIGYMPENVPLYEDMRVREYLKFRAQLKGLGSSDTRRRVGEVHRHLRPRQSCAAR